MALCAVAALTLLVGCANKKEPAVIDDQKEVAQKEEYPQIAYINEISYYGTGQECMQVPRKAPEGTIETFTPAEIMPDAPFSANFGQEYDKLEYMFLDDGNLIIHIGDKWMIFEAQ